MNTKLVTASALTVLAITMSFLKAQAPARAPGGRGGVAAALFTALDADKDGTLTRSEMESAFNSWFTSWDAASTGSLTHDQLLAGLNVLFPPPPPLAGGVGGGFNPAGNSTPMTARQTDIEAMMAALPSTPGVKPLRARKVLVYAHTGPGGFVHASIPLAAKTVEELGNQGGLWTTTISYDAADISAANLKQYDAIFLDSTTGCFLDDKDPAVTAVRRAAFMDFVRSGKGIAAIHAATDSYHTDCLAASAAASGGGGGASRGGAANILATQFLEQAGKSNDGKVTRQEFAALADTWFDKLDTNKSGTISRADFIDRFNSVLMPAAREGRQSSGRSGGRSETGSAMARVQQADRRLFQVSLARSSTHHGED